MAQNYKTIGIITNKTGFFKHYLTELSENRLLKRTFCQFAEDSSSYITVFEKLLKN